MLIKTFIKNNKGLGLATEIQKASASLPTAAVILVHGFTGYKEENNLIDIADRLEESGITSVRFTASGFGDSEGTLEKDYRFSNYFSDLESVYRYLIRQTYIDPTKIGICGHSMGGSLAILFVAEHPEIKALAIISSPITFFSSAYGRQKDEWKKKGYFEKISGRDQKSIRIPYAYVEDVDIQNVLKAANKITAKTICIAGSIDNTVSWKDTKRICNSIKGPHEFLLLDGMDHWYKRKPDLLPLVHLPIINFFQNNLLDATGLK